MWNSDECIIWRVKTFCNNASIQSGQYVNLNRLERLESYLLSLYCGRPTFMGLFYLRRIDTEVKTNIILFPVDPYSRERIQDKYF